MEIYRSRKKILYGDNLAVVSNDTEELQKALQERSITFKTYSLRMNLDKTEIMWIGEQDIGLHVDVDGKAIKQVNSFIYFDSAVCGWRES